MTDKEQSDAANLKAAGMNDTGTGAAGTDTSGSPIPGAKPGEPAPGQATTGERAPLSEAEKAATEKAATEKAAAEKPPVKSVAELQAEHDARVASRESSIAGKSDNKTDGDFIHGKGDAFDTEAEGNSAPRLTNVNDPTKEAQIARADEAMMRKNEANAEGFKVIEEQHDKEEEVYEALKDAPPTSGKAIDTNTPTIDKHGNRSW